MASDHELAALKAQVVALESRMREHQGADHPGGGKASRAYIVKAQVFDECVDLPAPDEPAPAEPAGGESVQARLGRIETQLRRIIAKLEA